MAEITLRPMRVSDLPEVMAIEAQSFATPWSYAALEQEITQNKCARYQSLLRDGRVIGYAGMWLVIDEAHVTNIAVDGAYRGQGYGERIMRALIKTAADEDARQMTLEVRRSNHTAQALYRKLGFAEVGVRRHYYDDNKEDALLMTLSPILGTREEEVAAYWQAFLRETGKPPDTRYIECFHFEMLEEVSNELLSLTLGGQKRATCSSALAYRVTGEKQPEPGDFSIVTDFFGHPRCIIQTTAAQMLPFHSVSWEMARREGEDETLASWRQNHVRFFTREGEALGYAFSWDMQVIFEDFVIVYR